MTKKVGLVFGFFPPSSLRIGCGFYSPIGVAGATRGFAFPTIRSALTRALAWDSLRQMLRVVPGRATLEGRTRCNMAQAVPFTISDSFAAFLGPLTRRRNTEFEFLSQAYF